MTSRTRGRPGWRIFRCSSRTPTSSTPTTTPTRFCQYAAAAILGRDPHLQECRPSRGAIESLLHRRRQCRDAPPPSVVYPGFININTTQDVAINLTKVMGRHTFKTGALQQPQPEAGEQRPRRHQLRDRQLHPGHRRRQSVRHVLRLLERGDRELQLLRAGVQSTSRDLQSRQPRSLRAGQLEGEVQAGRSTTASASSMPSRSTTRAPAERQLPAGQSGCSRRRRRCYVPGCVGNTATCAGSNRSAKNPLTGAAPRPEHLARRRARSCRTPATSGTACSSRGTRSRTRHTSSRS